MIRRTVLLIAYHFPPFHGSSGVQRTLRFAQHLPRFGWRPIVLTASPRAYESTARVKGNEIPRDLMVHRAFGLDAARQLSVFGRYPRLLAVPDRWTTWRFWAVPAAMRIIREHKVDVVWSTFPIATAHRIGLDVARRSGLPWVAEFRDPMWQGKEYPPEARMNKAWQSLEAETCNRAQRIVVTTPRAASEYADRFAEFDQSRLVLIENGYDEETFQRASESLHTDAAPPPPGQTRRITLLHSGIIYKSARDPTQLFVAIAALKDKGLVSSGILQVVLRASGDEAEYGRDLESLRIQDIVRLEPAIDYVGALREMLTVDGLLILQASNCNAQIPAKFYEYLRANRPIIALTDPAGDTARALESAGVGLIARLDSAEDIQVALMRCIEQIRNGTWSRAPQETVSRYSRQAQAGELARVFTELT